VTGYRIMARHLVEMIGNVKLVELKLPDMDCALGACARLLRSRSPRRTRSRARII
jgi:hypothetical protein